MSARDYAQRHVHALDGKWIYSHVTLSCGCAGLVANPQREITTHDPWYCMNCHKVIGITKIEPVTLSERDALCQPA